MNNNINDFSEQARVWVYQANRQISENEIAQTSSILSDFVKDWKAHGTPLKAGFAVKYGRFIIIAVDETPQPATGCSIDASVAVIKKIEEELNVSLLNRMEVAYRMGNTIQSCSLADFKKKIQQGEIDENTLVFNNMVGNVGQLRSQWEITLQNSWHSRYLQTT